MGGHDSQIKEPDSPIKFNLKLDLKSKVTQGGKYASPVPDKRYEKGNNASKMSTVN